MKDSHILCKLVADASLPCDTCRRRPAVARDECLTPEFRACCRARKHEDANMFPGRLATLPVLDTSRRGMPHCQEQAQTVKGRHTMLSDLLLSFEAQQSLPEHVCVLIAGNNGCRWARLLVLDTRILGPSSCFLAANTMEIVFRIGRCFCCLPNL